MSTLKGSRTEANLAIAFAGEAQAATKYSYYASQARQEGHIEISNIFSETAANEHAHGKIWFKLLHNNEIPQTKTNLIDAAEGEHYERAEMYLNFAKEADEEGFTSIAALFRMVAQIEHRHELRFLGVHSDVENQALYQNESEVYWICINCGYVCHAKKAPAICPVCAHPQGFFRQTNEELPPKCD